MTRDLPGPWLDAAVVLLHRLGGRRVVEVGSLRLPPDHPNTVHEGGSTLRWAQAGFEVFSIDVDPAATSLAAAVTGDRPAVHCITADGVGFLEGFDQPIDLLYLDAWDVGTPNYKQHHLDAYHAARRNLHERSLVLIDDMDLDHGGKGEQVVPAALADGFHLACWGRVVLLSRAPVPVDFLPVGPALPGRATQADALALHQRGLTWHAEVLYEHLLRTRPNDPALQHLLGVVRQQRGNHAEALRLIGRAIAADASQGVYFNNYGAALLALERPVEALACFHRALQIRPEYADAHANLGLASRALGQPTTARAAFRAALQHHPDHPVALRNAADLESDLGDLDAAVGHYRSALTSRPTDANLHFELGNLLLNAKRADCASRAYEDALRCKPDFAAAHANLSSARAAQDQIDAARQALDAAIALNPGRAVWPLRHLHLCPAVFDDVATLDAYRTDLENRLDAVLAAPPKLDWRDLGREACQPSFNLAHHGRPNRTLKGKFAALFTPAFAAEPPPPATGKPRIGFVVTHQHEGCFLRNGSGVAVRLDRDLFDTVVFWPRQSLERGRRELGSHPVEVVPLSPDLADAVATVRAARCDVVYFWEVGTDPLNYFLPFARLAPVQCTSWGTQVTTGNPAVDYYLSADLVEGPSGESHYSERLWRLSTLPTYQGRVAAPPPTGRDYFGLPENRHLYLCPQSLLKFHPDTDDLFGGVLRADPAGVLVLKEGRYPQATQALKARFARTLADVIDRIIWVPWQSLGDYFRLLSVADVVLDTPHFGAGSTAYDLFSLGQSVVALEGEFNVGRTTAACYRKMGLPGLVCATAAEYLGLAHRLATEPDYRREVRLAVSELSEVLFNDADAVREHDRFFATAVAETRGQSASPRE